ncbi:hypothetical protein SAMN02982929_04557 [Saccharopolyspora kobensis]|uniref:Uncharacterized protein n=1 Tax=Saccharopolyspora kobensis TaxID=146035 RepID=A0A1H6DKZ4_9PSEU|nr:hypothetical protein SAMN02982929_04557 [Saccharopolyspora kobensis]SFD24888.1 hypothetical protein SAMN05216506_103233 [Saccharopolyspora kobensis]
MAGPPGQVRAVRRRGRRWAAEAAPGCTRSARRACRARCPPNRRNHRSAAWTARSRHRRHRRTTASTRRCAPAPTRPRATSRPGRRAPRAAAGSPARPGCRSATAGSAAPVAEAEAAGPASAPAAVLRSATPVRPAPAAVRSSGAAGAAPGRRDAADRGAEAAGVACHDHRAGIALSGGLGGGRHARRSRVGLQDRRRATPCDAFTSGLRRTGARGRESGHDRIHSAAVLRRERRSFKPPVPRTYDCTRWFQLHVRHTSTT